MTTHARAQPPVAPTQSVEDEFEPDAEWKAALKARLELDVASLVEGEERRQRMEMNKPGISDSDRLRLAKQYKQVADVKSLMKKQYDIDLEKERDRRRWNAGQPVPGSYLKDEQQRIMNNIMGINNRASTPTQTTFPSSSREHMSPKRLSSHHHPRISDLSNPPRASTPSGSPTIYERPWVEEACDDLPSLRTRLAADIPDRLENSKSRSSLRFHEETAIMADEARKLGQRLVAKREEARLKLENLENGAKYTDTESRKSGESMRKREEKLRKDSEEMKQAKRDVQNIVDRAKEEQTKISMLAEDTRKREEDIQMRERALYSREKDIRQREEDVIRREDKVKKTEDDAKQKENELRSQEGVVKQREETLSRELEQIKQLRQELQKIAEQSKEDQKKIASQAEDTLKKAQAVLEREQAVALRETEVQRREQDTLPKEVVLKNAEMAKEKEREAEAKRTEEDALEAQMAEAHQRAEVERFLQERDRVAAGHKQDEEEESGEESGEEDDEEDDDDEEDGEEDANPNPSQPSTDQQNQEEETRRKQEHEREEAANAEAARRLQLSDLDGPDFDMSDALLEHPKIIEEQKYIWQQLQFANQANSIQRKRMEERSRIDIAAESSSRPGDPSPTSAEVQSSSASTSPVLNVPTRSASTMPTLTSSMSSLGLGQPSHATQTSHFHTRASSAMSWVKPVTPKTSPQMARVPSLLPSSPTLERRNSTPTPWLPPSLHIPATSGTSSTGLSQLSSPTVLPPGKLHTRSVSSSTTYSSSASTHSMTGLKDWQRSAHTEIKSQSYSDIQRIFEKHERLWMQLYQKAELTWLDFPWPMFNTPADPTELSSTLVSAYIYSAYWPEKDGSKTVKDRIKDQMKRWHPDTFETKYLVHVARYDRDKVRLGAGAVARCLSDLLWQENEKSPAKDRVEKKHAIYVTESDRLKMASGNVASHVTEQPFARARAASASHTSSSRPLSSTHVPYIGVSSASSSLGVGTSAQSPVSPRAPSLFSRASSSNIHNGVPSSLGSSNLSWSTSNRHSLIAEESEEMVTSGQRREDRTQVQRSRRVEEEVRKEGRWEEPRRSQEDSRVAERIAYEDRNSNAASRKPKAPVYEDRRIDQSPTKVRSVYIANRERRERERKDVKVVVEEESDDETHHYRRQSILIDSRTKFEDVDSKPIVVPKPAVAAGTYASIIGYRE